MKNGYYSIDKIQNDDKRTNQRIRLQSPLGK